MTLALLMKFGPWLLAALGVLFGMFRHQQASTATAKANQKVAEADARAAQNDAVAAQANEAAAQTGAAAVKERTDVENQIASAPAGESARILRDDWSRS